MNLPVQIKSAPGRAFSSTVAYLLPHGYPNTVAPSYAHYASWTSLGMMFSSVTSGTHARTLCTFLYTHTVCCPHAGLHRARVRTRQCTTRARASALQCCPPKPCCMPWVWAPAPFPSRPR
ncbi:hypothetical protein EON68_02790 [archaeon]|nr:MAG: hypothetical protein EON68_02790 [archaeon]